MQSKANLNNFVKKVMKTPVTLKTGCTGAI